jgi:hypothetical protein
MHITTIEQLDNWMTENCYNDHSYAIGNRMIDEGFGLKKIEKGYIWYYTERGEINQLNSFETEKEAVLFALQHITNNEYANRHMIGFLKSKSKTDKLIKRLNERNIWFFMDKIPFGGVFDPRFRIFVFGCDIKKVVDLIEKYDD